MKIQKKRISAYLTVYMALCMAVMISLSLALIEGVRSNTLQLEAECITDVAMNSILAEYHRELFRNYNILAVDSSYGTLTSGKRNTEDRLRYYLERNMEAKAESLGILKDFFYKDFLAMHPNNVEITGVSILTDQNGGVFRKQAVDVMKADIGITTLQEIQKWLEVVEAYDLRGRDIDGERRQLEAQMKAYDGSKIKISETETVTVGEDVCIENPVELLDKKRQRNILDLVISQKENLSYTTLNVDSLVYSRMKRGEVNQGNLWKQEIPGTESMIDQLLFHEYLLKYMSHYGEEASGDTLEYQVEYMLMGNALDAENLEKIAHLLCGIREVANVAYLVTDQGKCAEAEVVATAICALVLTPELKDILKGLILIGWAYAESLYDVKQLFDGKRVALIKDRSNWHYSLQGALSDSVEKDSQLEVGLSYEDYLRILLCFEDLEELTGRALNIMEAQIRLTPGNQNFRLDACYETVEASMEAESAYGYCYKFSEKKHY